MSVVDISSIAPKPWEGEITPEKLDMIISGLEIPNQAMSVRLAIEVKNRLQVFLDTGLLDYIRFLGELLGEKPEDYAPPAKYRGFVYAAAERWRNKHIAVERQEEFYTILLAAFEDGQKAGRGIS